MKPTHVFYYSDYGGIFTVGDVDHWDLVWLDVCAELGRSR